jgi:hypothetical protein
LVAERGIHTVSPIISSILNSMSAVSSSSSTSCPHSHSVCAYYSLSSPSSLVWSHSTNSLSALTEALQTPVHFIEFDLRHHPNDPSLPIVSHDPIDHTDIHHSPLSFSDWLDCYLSHITHHHALNPLSYKRPGLKFDFKTLESILPSLSLLYTKLQLFHLVQDYELNGLIWFNADIFHGPNGNLPSISDQLFIKLITEECKFSNIVLSIGWTTCYPGVEDYYSSSHLSLPLSLLASQAFNNYQITFPVRAKWFLASFDSFTSLLSIHPNLSLTLWNGRSASERTVEEYDKIIKFIQTNNLEQRMFVDYVKNS